MNNKGFTKIGMLFITLIVVGGFILLRPYIIKLIDKNKEQKLPGIEEIDQSKLAGAKLSLKGYIDVVELTLTTESTTNLMDINSYDGTYTTQDGNIYPDINNSEEYIVIDFRGDKPEDRKGFMKVQNGQVIDALLYFNGIEVTK